MRPIRPSSARLFSPLALLLAAACGHGAPDAGVPTQPAPPSSSHDDLLAPQAKEAFVEAQPAQPASDATVGPAPVTTTASAVPPPDAEPPPLPKGTVVLHVGDSMADALGKDLKRELEARGIRNILKAKEATYIPQWAGFSMGFPGLVAGNNPDLVIVTLGGNEVGMPDPTQRAEQVRKIVHTIGDRPCLWIAPPLWGPHTGILDVIRQNCAPCVYVDTNVLIPDLERLGDGVHPTIPERRRWAKFMIGWLLQHRDPGGARPWDMKPGSGG